MFICIMQYASPINSSLSQLLSHLRALVLSPTNLTDLSVMVRLTGADWSGSERSSWPCCCCCGSTARSSCWGSPRTIWDNSPSLQERHLFIFSHISYIRHTCSMVLQLHAGLLGLVSIACVLGFGGNNFGFCYAHARVSPKSQGPKTDIYYLQMQKDIHNITSNTFVETNQFNPKFKRRIFKTCWIWACSDRPGGSEDLLTGRYTNPGPLPPPSLMI